METNVDTELNEFVVRPSPALLRVAYALTGNAQTAEDLVQRALAKAFVRWRRIHAEAEPYVKRIIYRSSASRWRRRSRRAETTMAAPPDHAPVPDASHDTALRLVLRAALLGLPPRQRAVLVLRYLEDLSVDETAEILGCRPGTVASQASRALAKLRDLVPDDARPSDESVVADEELRPLTDRLDNLIRDVVHDHAAGADIVSDRDRRRLALNATDRGHSLRNRRRAAVVGSIALVVAMAVGVPYGLRHLAGLQAPQQPGHTAPSVPGLPPAPAGVPTHIIDDTSQPIELVDGWYVVGNRMVLNRTTNTYAPFGAATILPSPNGRWVATTGSSTNVRVYDLDAGTSHLIQWGLGGVIGIPEWSPDGETLLVTGPRYNGDLMAVFFDVTEQSRRYLEFDASGLECAQDCLLTWMPTGNEIGLLLVRDDGSVAGLQQFNLDGERTRMLPIHGYPRGIGSWSPDGRHVIVNTSAGDRDGAEVIDVATGDVVRRLDLPMVVQAQWIDNDRFLIWEPIIADAKEPYSRTVVSLWTLDGTLLERWVPPIEIARFPPALASLVARVG